jgi:hypothetical protein
VELYAWVKSSLPSSAYDAEEMFSRKEVIGQVLEAANFVEVVAALNASVK